MPDGLIAIILVALTVAAVWIATRLARNPAGDSAFLRESTRLRAIAWTCVLDAAAIAGSLLGGGTTIALACGALGFVLLLVELRLWSMARTFGRRH